jgi:hypothetical protein
MCLIIELKQSFTFINVCNLVTSEYLLPLGQGEERRHDLGRKIARLWLQGLQRYEESSTFDLYPSDEIQEFHWVG